MSMAAACQLDGLGNGITEISVIQGPAMALIEASGLSGPMLPTLSSNNDVVNRT